MRTKVEKAMEDADGNKEATLKNWTCLEASKE
jgi:hypothetical protein